MDGQPRGFWARGPRWAAHAGVLGEVVAPPGPDRFRFAAAASRSWADMGDGREALRFYGGFSFRDDHRPKEHWEAFPPGLFHLPAVELDGEGEGPARLRVRVPVQDDAPGARERAEASADLLLSRLAGRRDDPADAAGSVAARTRAGDQAPWLDAVERTLAAIRRGSLSKAVLARTLDVELSRALSTAEVVLALWSQHPGTHAFLFEPRPGTWLLGAAPEALATLRDGRVTATAVAGSVRRGSHPDEDRALARSLLASGKDRAEHRVVVEDMMMRLRALTRHATAEAEPHVLTLARIQHLETEIEGEALPARPILSLVEALHPTPAVCGVPRDAALAFLHDAEPFHRGWYAGPVGWFDTEGEGHCLGSGHRRRGAVSLPDRNTLWARALLQELVRCGVREICVAPGSRSTPLVLAASREEGLRVRVFLDERSAAFFALGVGKGTGTPASVITTSGTAVANLLPAVVEACQSEVPLLLVTADRPHHLRDSDANQAIHQPGIFGGFTRAAWDLPQPRVEADALLHLRAVADRAVAAARGRRRAPSI
ncbi:MAG: isochorismate synthase [Gemmatimonadota bacterium]